MSQEEKIKELELKIKEKDAELEKLYSVVGSLNSCLSGIIQDTEAGIRAATSLYRKFASKKLQKMVESASGGCIIHVHGFSISHRTIVSEWKIHTSPPPETAT